MDIVVADNSPHKGSSASGASGASGASAYLAAALELRSRFGWSVFPVVGKVPVRRCKWKRFQTEAPGKGKLRRLFARPGVTGLAVVCGRVSGDLTIRDFDRADSYLGWAEAHPDLANTLPTVRTAQGYHVYFRRAEVDRTISLGDGELRGEGGYCLLPPSTHPDTGQPYTWVVPPSRDILPLVDPTLCGLCPPSLALLSPLPSPHKAPIGVKPGSVEGENIDGLVEEAIRATMPTGEGVRHTCLFQFERRLKAIAGLADRPAEDLEPFVREWWLRCVHLVREKRWEETWRDFRSGWIRVGCPLGPGASEGAIALALPVWLDRAAPLDPWASDQERREQQLLRLELVCEALSGIQGGRQFPLGQEFAAAVLGVSRPTARDLIAHLERRGIIVRAREYNHLRKLAREWLYRGPIVVELGIAA
jgi:hypothetical protein